MTPIRHRNSSLIFITTRPRLVGFSYILVSVLADTATARSPLIRWMSTTRGGSTNVTQAHSVDSVGGGAINEKERNLGRPFDTTTDSSSPDFDPLHTRSHLFHALEGLDRYPNYMSRWNVQDMDTLEEALRAQLEKVVAQKRDIVHRRQGIDAMVQRLDGDDRWKKLLHAPETWEEIETMLLDPRIAKVIIQSQQFQDPHRRPSVEDVLNGMTQVELDPAQLETLMEEEMFDVYSLPLLSVDFCTRLREYVRELSQLGESDEFAHLQLGRRAVDLDTVGLSWLNDLLFQLIIRPIARHLFHETESKGELDWRQGYVAGYSVQPTSQTSTPRHRLVPHTDDSEVTLNVCLGDDFHGGALNFRGLRGTTHAGQLVDTFEPQLGKALLHAGRHLHEVTQVTSGDRYAYIIWARSWGGVRASTCPCCWLNRRRQDDSCICGAQWN